MLTLHTHTPTHSPAPTHVHWEALICEELLQEGTTGREGSEEVLTEVHTLSGCSGILGGGRGGGGGGSKLSTEQGEEKAITEVCVRG